MGYSVTQPTYSEKFNYLAVFKNVKYLIWSWSCNMNFIKKSNFILNDRLYKILFLI